MLASKNSVVLSVVTDLGTPLHVAYRLRKTHLVEILVACGAQLNAHDREGCAPIHDACRYGDVSIVSALLQWGSGIEEVTGSTSQTPLHIASYHGHVAVVVLLLQMGAKVNTTDSCRKTPLHLASRTGHLSVARALL